MKNQYVFFLFCLFLALQLSSSAQSDAELKPDGVVMPRLSVYPASPDVGQAIFYIPNNQLEVYDGSAWKGSGSSTEISNRIEDSSDADTYIEAIEGSADYIRMRVENSSGNAYLRKCPNGDLRFELFGHQNTLVGYNSGNSLTVSANYNTMLGYSAGPNVTSGDYNTLLGTYAGYNVDVGSENTIIGASAGYHTDGGSQNTFIGRYAGFNNAGIESVVIGHRANISGSSNFNTIIGSQAFETMDNNSTQNVAIGTQVAEQADLTSYSVLVGYQSGQYLNDGYNVMLGYQAGQNLNNTNQVMKNNVCIGYQAGQENDGNNNVYIGKQSGTNNQGDGNIFIGNNAGSLPTAVSNQLRIANQNSNVYEPLIFGNFSNQRIGINESTPGANLHVKQKGPGIDAIAMEDDADSDRWSFEIVSDDLRLFFNGGSRGSFDQATGQYTALSDARFKTDISSVKSGTLEKILKLNPTSYHFKDDKKKSGRSFGLIAQEVNELFPNVVKSLGENDEHLGINYSGITVLAIQAIKEQQVQIDALTDLLQQQQQTIQELIHSK